MPNTIGYGQPSRSPTDSSAQDNQLPSSNLQEMIQHLAANQIAAADDHSRDFGDQVPITIDHNALADALQTRSQPDPVSDAPPQQEPQIDSSGSDNLEPDES